MVLGPSDAVRGEREVGIAQTEDLLVGAQGDVALEFVYQIGPDQDGFLRFYAEEVLPKV